MTDTDLLDRCRELLHTPDGVTREGLMRALVAPATTAPRPVLAPNFGDGANRAADLKAYLQAIPPGQSVEFGDARIRCDQTVGFSNLKQVSLDKGQVYTDDVTGDGNPHIPTDAEKNTARYKAVRTRAHLRAVDCEDLTIGLTVVGANPGGGLADGAYKQSLEAQAAFDLKWCRRTRFLPHSGAQKTWGDSITMSGNDDGKLCERTWIDGTFGLTGRQIFALTGALDTTLGDRVVTLPGRRSCIDIEANGSTPGWNVSGLTILGGDYGAHRGIWLTMAGQNPFGDLIVRFPTVHRAEVAIGSGDPNIRFQNIDIEGVQALAAITTPSERAWRISRADHVRVVGNHQPLDNGKRNTRSMTFLGLVGCTDYEVHDNTFPEINGYHNVSELAVT